MTSLNEPADVLVEEGPPESFKEASPDDEDTLVSERVVSSPDKIESAARMNVDLMLPVVILAPELAITVEKVERLSDKVAHGGLSESDGCFASRRKVSISSIRASLSAAFGVRGMSSESSESWNPAESSS